VPGAADADARRRRGQHRRHRLGVERLQIGAAIERQEEAAIAVVDGRSGAELRQSRADQPLDTAAIEERLHCA
jgi:hypothetical protein